MTVQQILEIRLACHALGMVEPISIEPDGTVWIGQDDNRSYPEMAPILDMVQKMTAGNVLP